MTRRSDQARGAPYPRILSAVLIGVIAAATVLASASCGGSAPAGSRQQFSANGPRQTSAGIDVAAENRKAGTHAWAVGPGTLGAQNAIEGYTDHASVAPGQSFRLYVSTTAPAFTVAAYRMGYYGGADGHLVWQSPQTKGVRQTAQSIDPTTHMVECGWQPSLTVATAGWVPGEYLLKLVSSTGNQRLVPLIVHSTATAGHIVLLSGITTWQAYNTWGGYSLYRGADGSYATRAREVSFDRPYLDPDEAAGDGLFFPFDQALVSFAEQHDLPVAYESDLELETSPQLFQGARAIVSDGSASGSEPGSTWSLATCATWSYLALACAASARA